MKIRSYVAIEIAIILLISCSFIGIPQVPSSPSPSIPFTQPVPAEPSATLEPSITPAPTITATLPALPTCEGNFTGIHITLPNNDWTCRVEQNTNNGSIYDEPIYLQSPLFTVLISNMGRGPYCGEDPNDKSCVVIDYYKNQNVTVYAFSYEGELREIFGNLAQKGWISIHYQGMENRELTSDEKQELIQLLDSITFTK